MISKHDYMMKICAMVAAQCRTAFPALDLHFIVHNPGQLADRLPFVQEDIRRHKAYDAARLILEKTPMIERSSLFGMAMKTRSGFFGLGKRHHFLALMNINTDDVADSRAGRHLAYHLAFHAIDLMQFRLDPVNLERFSDGPMIPKRSPVNMALANLKADLFAVGMNFMQGNMAAYQETGRVRATQSITAFRGHRVEDYPYIISSEAIQYALDAMRRRGIPAAHQMVRKACDLAHDLTGQIDEKQIKQWHAFASPAQNMAWAGHPPEEILGAAVNTSENPYIRATGYLVAQYAGITPLSASTMMARYNSFTSFERNERLHKERMDSIFESALSRSLREEASNALSDAANEQNIELAEGNILGWCADALQSAGMIFDSSISKGREAAASAARDTFLNKKETNNWADLVDLGDKIIEEKRKGYAVTLGHVADLCADDPAFDQVRNALQKTMNDPSYQAKLALANDIGMAPVAPVPKSPAPAAPVPKSPAPRGPALAPSGPAGPTLGGGSAQMVRARELMRRKRLAEQQAQDSTE